MYEVSVGIIMQSVHSLVGGLQQVTEEVQRLQQIRTSPANDRFMLVMEVSLVFHPRPFVKSDYALPQPFLAQVGGSIEALKHMGTSLESELRSLLAYYGETPDSPEAPKPEDFFGLILSFSSSLQVRPKICSPFPPKHLIPMCRNLL